MLNIANNPELINKIKQDSFKALDTLANNGNFDATLSVALQLLKTFPEDPEVLQLVGLAYKRFEKHELALPCFEKALALAPHLAESHNNIFLCYLALGQYDKAKFHIHEALSINNSFIYLVNLAHYYRQIGNLDKAESVLESILSNDDYLIWLNLGGIKGQKGDILGAITCLERAIERNPDGLDAHVDLSYFYHLNNQWKEGFREYEFRMKLYKQAALFRTLFDQTKLWDGIASLQDKTIIIYCEQGMGDLINFIRFLPLLKAKGAKVLLETPDALENLFVYNKISDITKIEFDIATGQPKLTANYDYHCSILSLPHLLNISKEDVPVQTKIFSSEKANTSNYDKFYKIGIVWAGNPKHPRDAKRSFPLSLFRDIFNVPGVKLFSFQKDLRSRIHPPNKTPVDLTIGCDDMSIVDLSPYLKDFNLTASFIEEMDLIITADTAILHLAGAMNKKTYALIPEEPDWRWGLKTSTNVWYPSVELIRKSGTWEEAFVTIRKKILKELK